MSNKVNNFLNRSSAYKNNEENMFSNVYLVGFILILSLSFIGYAYYYIYYVDTTTINAKSSYASKDITLYEPLFNEFKPSISECINMCTNDIKCDGITYNSNNQMCTGTQNGKLYDNDIQYSAWVKPIDTTIKLTTDFSKIVLLGYTKSMKNIGADKLTHPYNVGFFAYSFNLNIYDFYKNFGSWRHVFHIGTQIDNGVIVDYQSWENLIKDFPIQSIGVWLAPFTNNLRIAITTDITTNKSNGSYPDAFMEKCNNLTKDCYITDMPGTKWIDKNKSGDSSISKTNTYKYVEFFDSDLQNIPINKQINITINFRGSYAEVYFDGKIVKVITLDGIPSAVKSGLYVMNDKSFGGEISNLMYSPTDLTLENINDIVNLKPMIK